MQGRRLNHEHGRREVAQPMITEVDELDHDASESRTSPRSLRAQDLLTVLRRLSARRDERRCVVAPFGTSASPVCTPMRTAQPHDRVPRIH